jgi:RNA polymerase sigma-70 factor (ECF subfamily)
VSNPSPGDDGFRAAALEHIDALYGYAVALARDRSAAEDLVQEAYLRAIRGAARFERGTNLKAWLFAILRNLWLNELRHSRSGPCFVSIDARAQGVPSAGAAGDPYREYSSKEAGRDVRDAIDRLPEAYREVIVLRDIEGLSYGEIAAVIGCPAGTVMSRLGRARQKLRHELVAWRAEAAS